LTPNDLAILREVGAAWERPSDPIDWEKL
jgi:hypothetical protein